MAVLSAVAVVARVSTTSLRSEELEHATCRQRLQSFHDIHASTATRSGM
jgi:hypothetical protein